MIKFFLGFFVGVFGVLLAMWDDDDYGSESTIFWPNVNWTSGASEDDVTTQVNWNS